MRETVGLIYMAVIRLQRKEKSLKMKRDVRRDGMPKSNTNKEGRV